MDELEEVDGAVEEGRFEIAFEVDVVAAGFVAVDVSGEVDEGGDVNCKLAEDGADDVGVENVGLGALFGETFYGLWMLLVAVRLEGSRELAFAREMERKQTLISMPLIVTWPSPNLMPSRYRTLRL